MSTLKEQLEKGEDKSLIYLDLAGNVEEKYELRSLTGKL
jgi:hypothetical protein